MIKKNVACILIIVLSVVIVIGFITRFFVRKTDYNMWNSFYGLENNTIDVAIIGSSMIGCAIDPYQFSEQTGLNCINMSVPGTTYSIRTAFLKEILKTQDIDLLIVETWRYKDWPEMDSNNILNAIGGMKMGWNKFDLIMNIPLSTDKYDRIELLFPFLAYHSRWSELSAEDTVPLSELKSRYTLWDDGGHMNISPQGEIQPCPDEVDEFTDIQKKYIDELISEAEKTGVNLLFFDPQNPEIDDLAYSRLNAVNAYLAENNIPYIEGNLEAQLVAMTDTGVDFCDTHHTNLAGTYKSTMYVAEYINDNYSFEKSFSADWAEYREYIDLINNQIKQEECPEYYLMLALNSNYNVYVSKGNKDWDNTYALALLENVEDNMSSDMMNEYFDDNEDYNFRIIVEDKYTGETVDVREF